MKVTVVIPVYNYEEVLTRAAASVIGQTYDNWEAIIVNDGSTDGSGIVADDIASWDHRVRVIHQDNAGLSGALNTGFSAGTGDAFCILSADDALAHDHLASTVKAMQSTGADIISSDMLVNNSHRVLCKPGSLEALKRGNCHHYAALFKRKWFDLTGGFKLTMNPSWEDYEFWLHCAKRGAAWYHVNKMLFLYYPTPSGRDASAQGQDTLLKGKMHGYHQDVFGKGAGVVVFIIPTYNHEEYVRLAVESARAQTYPHVEVVVIVDGSEQKEAAAVKGLDCVVLEHDRNRGLSAARNTGLVHAMDRWQPQYFVCLDADDEVEPGFVERTMAAKRDKTYVYTDILFSGDAWHVKELHPFKCVDLPKRHQHPCTFLADTGMWSTIVSRRGYGYDEGDELRVGYEDHDFALAAVEAGWCGLHLPEPLFKYRQHQNGSMRTRANAEKPRLSKYIYSRHPWANSRKGAADMCKGCGGGGRYTRGAAVVKVAAVGTVPLDAPLMVTYTGNQAGSLTKQGSGGQVYKPSATNRVFFIAAVDAHLFAGGPYTIQEVPREGQAVTEEAHQADVEATRVKEAVAQRVVRAQVHTYRAEETMVSAEAAEPDDLTTLPAIGKGRADKLIDAGISTYADVAEEQPAVLARILGRGVDVEEVQAHARLLARSS
jgi:glycosyltransferase involved in cell wall biosynthesis/predicted flap endonuclease-1-like 5' DNA nuclease